MKKVYYVLALSKDAVTVEYWSNLKEGGVTSDRNRARKYSRAEDALIAWRKLCDRPGIGFVKADYMRRVEEVPDRD